MWMFLYIETFIYKSEARVAYGCFCVQSIHIRRFYETLRERICVEEVNVHISELNFRASHHLVSSERTPRSTLSLESNSLYFFDYYEECNSISLNNLAQCSPHKTPESPAAFVPLVPLSPLQEPSLDLNNIQMNNVFLTGPPPPPPPNLASTNLLLEHQELYQSSLLEYPSESVRQSLHWNCRAKIVATPTVTSKFTDRNRLVRVNHFQLRVLFLRFLMKQHRFLSPLFLIPRIHQSRDTPVLHIVLNPNPTASQLQSHKFPAFLPIPTMDTVFPHSKESSTST